MQLSTNNDQKKKKKTQNYIVSFEHLHQTMQNKKKKKGITFTHSTSKIIHISQTKNMLFAKFLR